MVSSELAAFHGYPVKVPFEIRLNRLMDSASIRRQIGKNHSIRERARSMLRLRHVQCPQQQGAGALAEA